MPSSSSTTSTTGRVVCIDLPAGHAGTRVGGRPPGAVTERSLELVGEPPAGDQPPRERQALLQQGIGRGKRLQCARARRAATLAGALAPGHVGLMAALATQ